MSGIYIHIPFCKQACHYCDFHFSTSLKKKEELLAALVQEIQLRKEELIGTVDTIYFGGGTPSLLTALELKFLIDAVYANFNVTEAPEITLEANPDDLTETLIHQLSNSPINRLSIGVQSFFEEDLQLMNRAHNAKEAEQCIKLAKKYFSNISIDLIYGIPEMTNKRWLANIEKALELDIPHLSCYALTVEPKTALEKFIKKGIVPPVEDDVAQEHHTLLVAKTEAAGYRNYEFSNFSKPGWESRNNTAYWQGKPYLGIGPSAHSYNGQQRSWNVANNTVYIRNIEAGELPIERESLSVKDKYNEYVMTRLRTADGISVQEISVVFGTTYATYLLQQATQHIASELLQHENERLIITKKGKFLTDGIASDLFLLELQR
ncbi:MAG: coproporphyrinogen III oxidase [Flavobacteriaceae bacterium]|nr:coproporphyrinogen III oxidase [Flavobacteriaceae bacterium]